jgi:hypothetical protein
VILASALAITMTGGVAAAVTGQSSGAKACVAKGGGLRIAAANGKCAKGQSKITLGATGPAGARGPKGATGAKGATGDTGAQGVPGDTGPAGSGKRVNFTQNNVEATSVSHFLGQAGPISFNASCQGTGTPPTSPPTKLVLSVTGGTQTLSYTASSVSNATGATVASLTHGVGLAVSTPGATASQMTPAFDSESTTTSGSAIVTIVVEAEDGTQVTGTFDVEISTAGGDTPACIVGGTIAAA